jgi:hypothetical protein
MVRVRTDRAVFAFAVRGAPSLVPLAAIVGCTVRDYYRLPPDSSTDAEVTIDSTDDAEVGQAMFDIAFADHWKVDGTEHDAGQPATLFTWSRVINMGTTPLRLASGTTISVVDNNQVAFDATVTWGSIIELDPGNSTGALSTIASQLIVDSGLSTEPVQAPSNEILRMEIVNFAPSGSWLFVRFDVTIQIGNARAILPITLVNDTSVSLVPDGAERVSSAPQ